MSAFTSTHLDGSDVPPSNEQIEDTVATYGGDSPVPASWLDRLISTTATLPSGAGREGLVQAFVDALADILPAYAVGARVKMPGQEQGFVVHHVPLALMRLGTHSDPMRLFPMLRHERIVPLEDAAGSTLHVAHHEPGAVVSETAEQYLLERGAILLRGALEQLWLRERIVEQSAELRQLRAQIIQSEKLASLGQIAAGVVHELNNPLTSIVAYSDYLRKKAEQRSPGNLEADDIERIRRIGEAAERILRFSRDLGAYARPSSGRPEWIYAHDVIEQALVFCEHVLAKAGVQVDRDYTPDLKPLCVVGGELTQVFVNLITNACHAMPEGSGHLTIRTRLEQEVVCIEVMDNGHGIADRNLSKVFEPFFTTKTEGRGTGLGLSIVRNIVTSHGGNIRAESDGIRGAQFIVRLPIGAGEQSALVAVRSKSHER